MPLQTIATALQRPLRCATDKLSAFELVVDATNGFVPLWEKGTKLRWRFDEASVDRQPDPKGTRTLVRCLLRDAMREWGDAAPVQIVESDAVHDFTVAVRKRNDCDEAGCTLASAFFPTKRREEMLIYPFLLSQTLKEQVATLVHELGHVFGLRHYFANISETDSPSAVFGVHRKFTIMNYGAASVLTDEDRKDLKRLYEAAWGGQLTKINGIPVRFVKAYHATHAL
ncbi:hypothetical protein [Variovorax sp. J22R115]|uniref:hypothetical protein n=1 Tax=Variovorax sp. J22R115 TaxID=3053509 RepID=UPI002577FC2C|nr:hypothetical protein [Variovorax sp. J22R115]